MDPVQCGLLSWRPGFPQIFRHPKYYIFFLILLFKDASGAFFIGMRIPIGDMYDMNSFQFQSISAISNLGAVPVFLMAPVHPLLPQEDIVDIHQVDALRPGAPHHGPARHRL